MNEYIWIYSVGVLISCVSQALLKHSTIKHPERGLREYANVFVASAYMLLLVSLFISSQAIRHFQASLAPVIESSSYIYILFIGKAFFHEKITVKKLFGSLLIIIGIFVFNITI